MKKIINYCRTNYDVLVFVICVLLFPFLFAIGASNSDITQRIWSNILYACIILCILLCTKNRLRKIIAIGITIISFVPNMIVQSYLLMDKVIMKSTDFWVIFNTDFTEATNLFSTLKPNVLVWGILYTLLVVSSFILIFRKSDNKHSSPIALQIFSIIILFGVSLVNPFRSKVPMIDFYKSYWKYNREQRDVAEFYKNRQDLILDVQSTFPEEKNTLLIIIGESQNKTHMQLYGYPRQTNPQLMEIKDELTIYNDVCSPAIHTLTCMKQILTFTNYEQPDMYKKEANIIELLHFGGYKTFWFDNQGEDKNGAFAIDTYTPTSYRTMAKRSDVYNATGKPNDSIIIGALEMVLQDTTANKAIFLHLVGNHFDYSNRYEPSFAFFNDTTDINSPYLHLLSEQDIEKINAYDNATRYNDYIVRTCIEKIRTKEGRCTMLYLSDHGEEIFDYQNYCSRSFEKISPAMCEIPLILWMNEEYRNSCDLTLEINRPTCTDDIIHGIMDLAQIKYTLYDSTRSVFHPAYYPKERKVENIPLNDIRKKYQQTIAQSPL